LTESAKAVAGVVYVAEQEQPVRRRVALKVIKLGMDTRQVIARFEAERQALALMDHPNIAKVLDAGATERAALLCDGTGQGHSRSPLLRREPAEHARAAGSLFIQVCRPSSTRTRRESSTATSNLPTSWWPTTTGCRCPKVIDFGIAKATNQRLTDKTIYTALEQFIGTPAYMSPEQANLSGLDMDTRSDITAWACCSTSC
jgi:serine/threonine protein kinase